MSNEKSKENQPQNLPPEGNYFSSAPPAYSESPNNSQPQYFHPQGYPPQGYPPQGYPPQGYPPQGYPPQGFPPPQGYPPQGYSPQEYPPQSYPPQGFPAQNYQPPLNSSSAPNLIQSGYQHHDSGQPGVYPFPPHIQVTETTTTTTSTSEEYIYPSEKLRSQSTGDLSNGLPLIPTKVDYHQKRKSSGAAVGATVGGVCGFIVLGPIGLVFFGGAGAGIGSAIGSGSGKDDQKRFLKKQDLSNIRVFPKPEIENSRRCYKCENKFNAFNKRKHCGLCGKSFCIRDVSARVYVSFEGSKELKCCKICRQCWGTNIPGLSYGDLAPPRHN